ncbi:MAG: LytTR family transcriptional regulator [Alphaproteobacteria bacterium]|nr:LytTR family transcriptional regulator [Alphaproteobacteria bacterium]
MRESPYLKSWPYRIGPVLALAVVFAVIGPFGTYLRMEPGVRLLYFTIIGVVTWLQVIVLAAWFGTIEPIDRWPVAVRMTLVGMLAAIPNSIEVILVHSLLAYPMSLRAFPFIYPENAFLTVVISIAVGLFMEERLRARADAERTRVADLPQPAPADFFRRIPPALGRDLLALQMEDHYLRIHTALGSDLILLRLRDAVGELGSGRGQQVHRSWWVANGAVQSTAREGQRAWLVLRNGLEVPVSKTFLNQVREAGWLPA